MQIDTVVIGAGQAGLATSWALHQAGVPHVVLERGKVANSWATQRWDSFCLNTPNRYNGLPGAPYEGEAPSDFLHRDEVVESFRDYARRFDLPVREQSEVVRVCEGENGIEVHTKDGERFDCHNVVVASGILNTPKVPAAGAGLSDTITQVHSADYRNPDALPEGGVLVVGSGQSGVQIAEDLAEAGRKTWLATSFVGRGPRRYRGHDLFDWMIKAGMLNQTKDQLENPAEAEATQPQISGTKGGHTVSLQSLARQGVTLLGGVDRIDGTVVHLRDNLLDNAQFGDAFSARIKGMVDQAIVQAGADAPAAEPDPAEAPFDGLAAMAERRELDLDAENVRTVVWATGFGGDFSWLELPTLDDDGAPAHDGGVGNVPGVYFVGFPWLRARGSGLIVGVEADARHVVDHLVART